MAAAANPLDPESLVDAARRLGQQLLAQASTLPDGSRTWGRGFDVRRQPIADGGPFNGRCGEAIFLAALAAATGDGEFAAAARDTVRPLCRSLKSPDGLSRAVSNVGVGLAGIGGMLYAVTRCAEFLGDDDLVHETGAIAAGLAPDLARSDAKLELFWGSAGAILGLIAVADAGVREAAEYAVPFGERLLAERRTDPETGLRAWAPDGRTLALGFAHGTTGIACALIRLYGLTKDERYREAVGEAFAFERTLYRPDPGDWPDTRAQASSAMRAAWCHGAVGVGFARLAALRWLASPAQESAVDDLTNALKRATTARSGPDNLCCGSLGRLDLLLEAGVRLGKESLVATGMRMGRGMAQHVTRHGYTSIAQNEQSPTGPGFWQGLAGVGYTMLRLSKPDRYRSVLGLS